MAFPGKFDSKAANRALLGTRFAGKLHHFPTIDSTNTQLLAAAAHGAPEGTVFLADEQTAGRGRGDHQWHSAPGAFGEPDGLYVSALVKLALPLREALWVSLATGLAARTAIQEVAQTIIDIRWPNDLILRHAGPDGLTASRKLGGILVETAIEGEHLRHAVIGIGINLNQATLPPELAATASSLRIATGQPVRREALLTALLRALDLELTHLESGDGTLLDRFTRASTWVRGKRVHVAESGGYTGITGGLDGNGFLRVITDSGEARTVLSGGVREA